MQWGMNKKNAKKKNQKRFTTYIVRSKYNIVEKPAETEAIAFKGTDHQIRSAREYTV
jgi:hypothetical protein